MPAKARTEAVLVQAVAAVAVAVAGAAGAGPEEPVGLAGVVVYPPC